MKYDDIDWSGANCIGIDGDAFYYSAHEHDAMIEAETDNNNPYVVMYEYLSKVCSSCPIAVDCLEYALEHEEHGYWAGTSPAQRRDIRKESGITLRETYSPEDMDNLVIELREHQEQLLQPKEELYGVY